MKLHPIKDGPNKNTWCGPTAMSIALGITTDEAAATIRRVGRKRKVMGVYTHDLERAIEAHGFKYRYANFRRPHCGDSLCRPTVAQWLKRRKADRTRGRVFIILAGEHYWVISGRRWMDRPYAKGVPTSVTDKRLKKRARVTWAVEVTAA